MLFNRSLLSKKATEKLAALWLIIFITLLLIAAYTLPSLKFETNILKLLPEEKHNNLIYAAQEKQNTLLNQSIIWLVGAASEKQAYELATQLNQQLTASQLFEEVHFHWKSEDAAASYKTLLPYRYNFITAEDRHSIQHNPELFANQMLQMLYSPMGMQYAATLDKDPLFTLGRYINSLNTMDISLYQDAVICTDGTLFYALILAKTVTNNTDISQHKKLIDLYDQAKKTYHNKQQKLLVAGFPLYSAYGAQSAEKEISTIGSLSTLSVIILLLFAFRSAKPLILSLVSIGVGILAALTITHAVFDRLHIITLVFGSSLIGCIDYSFHYFCNSFQKNWNSFEGLKSIFTSIGLGMLGSVIAFASLALTPFPGLQQMAIFSASGLFFAWLTVILLFPFLSRNFQCTHNIPLARFYPWYLEKWPRFFKQYKIVLVILAIFIISLGFYRLNLQDDIRSMQKAKPELLEQETAIRALLKQKNDAQYFIVSGATVNDVLNKEQHLLKQLQPLIEQQKLESYSALSELYPSEQQQSENHQLLKTAYFDTGKIQQRFNELNMDANVIHDIENSINTTATIDIDTWLKAVPQPLQQQWLGCKPTCASIITLRGIHDITALEKVDKEAGIYWIDQVSTINHIMLQYRHIASLFVGIAALVIMLMLVYPLGLKAALTIICIPITAIFITVGITGIIGTAFNLFNVFALILVLGIAFDYSIFHYLGDDHKESTSFAVLLSLITTVLSFGLLMLSETTVIQSFGLTLSLGISCAFILSPLLSSKKGVRHE